MDLTSPARVVPRPAAVLQYLTWHLTHRGAVWASGAAQAAHVVRIILRGTEAFANYGGGVFLSVTF
jgi:hypothetical protein